MIITIDGPVATGKTTIAKLLSRRIGFIYIETGAMYRCATLSMIKGKIDIENEEAVAAAIENFEFDTRMYHGESRYFIQGEDVSDEIRGHAVTQFVSQVSAIPSVRKRLIDLQRQMVEGINAVCEGRDMGSFVFPDAYLKIYLACDENVRATRRYQEMCHRFPDEVALTSLEKIKKEIAERDYYDMNRAISPLKQPEGAFVIDTSELDEEEVVQAIIDFKDAMTVEQEGKF